MEKANSVNKCAACIVLYNPEIQRLLENINAIIGQVNKVYCYDNASDNIDLIEENLADYTTCVLIKGNKNIGIASAINAVCKKAKEEGHSWILTLDQDSICPPKMIQAFSEYFNCEKVGIICPRYIDSRRPNNKENKYESEISEVDFCITSGSLMNVEAFYAVGGMDDYLFVGSVDDEYCFRLINNGFKILQVNSAIINHELGNLSPSKHSSLFLKLGKALHSDKILALSYHREVSPLRVYYATRNIVYLSKKYKKHPYKFSKRFAIYNGISSIMRSKSKYEVFLAMRNGFIDGFRA